MREQYRCTLKDMAAFDDRSFNLTGTGDPVRVVGVWTTASLFSVLGISPALGSTFTELRELDRDAH